MRFYEGQSSRSTSAGGSSQNELATDVSVHHKRFSWCAVRVEEFAVKTRIHVVLAGEDFPALSGEASGRRSWLALKVH